MNQGGVRLILPLERAETKGVALLQQNEALLPQLCRKQEGPSQY